MSHSNGAAPNGRHPIWRCEVCCAWVHRNGESSMDCPWCPGYYPKGQRKQGPRKSVAMVAIHRTPPEPIEGAWADI